MDTGLCLVIALCIGLAAIAWALQPTATHRGPWTDQRRGDDQ